MKKYLFLYFWLLVFSASHAQTRFYQVKALENNVVHCLKIDQYQHKWLGVEGGIVQITADSVIKIPIASPDTTFKHLNISALALTDSCKWVGSYTSYIVKIFEDEKMQFFDFGILGRSLITDIAVSKDNKVWAASADKGVFVLDHLNRKMLFDEKNSKLLDNQVFRVLADKNNTIWFGTAKGLCSLDKTNTWEKYRLLSGQITAITEHQNSLWIISVTERGSELWQYENMKSWTNHILPKRIAETRIMDINFDAKNRLWIVADKVACFHNEEWFFFEEGFISQSALCVATDSDNDIWVGTEGKGLLTTAIFPKKNTIDEKIRDKKITSLDQIQNSTSEENIYEQAIPLKVQFEQGNANLSLSSEADLNQLGNILQANPSLQLRIEGHTDNVGNAAANVQLSQQRAEAVKNFLVKKYTIQASRISCIGYGGTKPIADNRFEETRSKNRRVEIVFSR